ncbi:MAG: LysR substrate-binding domain-containing protein [Pseudomonadota bacterium]
MAKSGMPLLNALKAFDAVVRLGSINKASLELSIAPSAVTQHIRNLEDFLGGDLFARSANSITINQRGTDFAQSIKQAFDLIGRATDATRVDLAATPIRLSCMPSLADQVISEPLARIYREYPDIKIRCDFSPDLASFDADTADIAVRYGPGDYPGAEAELLHVEEIAPVCSGATAGAIRTVADLGTYSRIDSSESSHDGSCLWSYWAREAGEPELAEQFKPRAPWVLQSSNFSKETILRAPLIALLEKRIVRDDLAKGTLVAPVGKWVPAPSGYHLVTPKRRSLSPEAKRLKALIKVSVLNHFREAR